MNHEISMIRATKRNNKVDLRQAISRFLTKLLDRMCKNKKNIMKQILNAEKNNERFIQIWNNEYMWRPDILCVYTAPEIAQTIYEIIQENEVNKNLSDVLEYPVKITVEWMPSSWVRRTAPKDTFIQMFIVWDQEELMEEKQKQDKYFEFAESGFAESELTESGCIDNDDEKLKLIIG